MLCLHAGAGALKNEGVAAEGIAQLDEWHLGGQPKRIFADTVHRLDGIVTNQENPLPEHHKRFKAGSHPVAGEFEVANVIIGVKQAFAQRADIGEKVLLEPRFAGADISEQTAFVFVQRNDGPFVKNGLLIAGIHLLRTSLNPFNCLVDGHSELKSVETKAIPGPWEPQFGCKGVESQVHFRRVKQVYPREMQPGRAALREDILRGLERFLAAIFAISLLFLLATSWFPGVDGNARVLELASLGLGTAATIAWLARVLPLQNLLLAAALIAGLSLGADLLSIRIGIRPPMEDGPAGEHTFRFLCAIAPVRVFEILNSRGLARLVVRRREPGSRQGIWVLACTVLLSVLFESTFQGFAAANALWPWSTVAPAMWPLVALVIAALITPVLINKKPGGVPERESTALLLWLLGSTFFLAEILARVAGRTH